MSGAAKGASRARGRNPFALTRARGDIEDLPPGEAPERALPASRPVSAEEQQAALTGCMLVPREMWVFVRPGDRVKYVRRGADGPQFSDGGYVRCNPVGVPRAGRYAPGADNADAQDRLFMRLNVSSWGNYKGNWTVAYDELLELYVEVRAMEAVLNATMHKVVGRIGQLEKRLSELERAARHH